MFLLSCVWAYNEVLQKNKKMKDAKFMHEEKYKEVETMFMTFERDELVKDDVWNRLTAKDDTFRVVDNTLHSVFGILMI